MCFSGGEPLRHSGLSTMLLAAADYGLHTTLYTCGVSSRNGTLKPMSDRIVDTVLETRTRVILSFHGADSSTHDSITGVSGSSGVAVETLRKTIFAGVRAEAHVVPMLPNYGEIERLAAILVKEGVNRLSWLRFVPQGRGALNSARLLLSTMMLQHLVQVRSTIADRYPGLQVRMGAPFNVLRCTDGATCDAAITVVTVRSDGSVAPCDGFKQVQFPDPYRSVLAHSLDTVYRESALLQRVRAYLQQATPLLCRTCTLHANCRSGCLAQRVAVAGWYADQPDPACPLLAKASPHELETASVR